ncbi:hypothetical protein YC2023_008277 [Brassica napus]
MNVWLSNKISGAKEVSWSKFLVVSFDNFRLPRYSSEMTFWVDEENKVVVFCVRDMEGYRGILDLAMAPELCTKFVSYPQGSIRRKPNRAHNQGIRRRNIING